MTGQCFISELYLYYKALFCSAPVVVSETWLLYSFFFIYIHITALFFLNLAQEYMEMWSRLKAHWKKRNSGQIIFAHNKRSLNAAYNWFQMVLFTDYHIKHCIYIFRYVRKKIHMYLIIWKRTKPDCYTLIGQEPVNWREEQC